MRCSISAVALTLGVFSVPATAFTPLGRRGADRSWTPAKETGPSQNRVGWSPKPTDVPLPPPRYGEVDLLRRDFTLGTATCGYVAGFSSIPVTCVRQSAYCTNDGIGNMDCCTGAYSQCTSSMFSSCIDYSSSLRGACSSKGPRTICCWAESASCFTLVYSTSASPGRIFSILQCQATGGLETLVATPPNFSETTPTTRPSESTSSTDAASGSATTTPSGSNNGGGTSSSSSAPVGAIVGGVVGGIAAMGAIAFLIFFFLIRNRRHANAQHKAALAAAAAAAAGGQPKPDVSQMQTPQPGYPQQQPNQSVYGAPGDFKPYGDAAAGQMPPPGHGPYGAYGYPPATTGVMTGTTATMNTTSPSPGYPAYGHAGQGGPYPPPAPGVQAQQYSELPVQYALGTDGRRAELGQ